MRKISLLLIVLLIAGVCNAQKGLPTLASINKRYFNIMPNDKNSLNVKVKIIDFDTVLTQVSEQALSIGDTIFARQLVGLHAIVSYNRELDSIWIELTPLEVEESSPYYEGVVQLKSGYITTVKGCFMQLSASILNQLIFKYQSTPSIEKDLDTVFVNVERGEYTDYYKFSNNYKDINITSKMKGQEYKSTMTALEMYNTLLINSIELKAPTLTSQLNFKYSNNNQIIQLQEINSKVKMPGVNVNVTFTLWDWEIK
jgi:hypothetical protein